MKEKVSGLKIVGYDERIPFITDKIKDKEMLRLGKLNVESLFVPFHTSGHPIYKICEEGSDSSVLMTGDSLFVSGIGKFFEGTPVDAYNAMIKIKSLPSNSHLLWS